MQIISHQLTGYPWKDRIYESGGRRRLSKGISQSYEPLPEGVTTEVKVKNHYSSLIKTGEMFNNVLESRGIVKESEMGFFQRYVALYNIVNSDNYINNYTPEDQKKHYLRMQKFISRFGKLGREDIAIIEAHKNSFQRITAIFEDPSKKEELLKVPEIKKIYAKVLVARLRGQIQVWKPRFADLIVESKGSFWKELQRAGSNNPLNIRVVWNSFLEKIRENFFPGVQSPEIRVGRANQVLEYLDRISDEKEFGLSSLERRLDSM